MNADTARKSALSLSVVVVLGVAALAWVTDGFAVVTAESARQRAVARKPLDLPVLHLGDQTGHKSVWPQALASDGRVSIVTFIYTSCKSICSVLNAQYRQMQEDLTASGLQNRVRLLTVSFDPQRDTGEVISKHAKALGVDETIWRINRPESEAELKTSLKRFGIVTVLDENGEFQHNAAWHVVDRQGRLAGIFAVDQPEVAMNAALELSYRP